MEESTEYTSDRLLVGLRSSGTLWGHWIPASFYFAFAAFYLVVIMNRCRALAEQQQKQNGVGGEKKTNKKISYCDVYVPEPNKSMLRRLSIPFVALSLLGVAIEFYGAYHKWGRPFRQIGHVTDYLCFTMVGFVVCLEGFGLLPGDSFRKAMCLVWFFQYGSMSAHANMKKNGTDIMIHQKMGETYFVLGVLWVYSVYDPKNLPAHLISWISVVFLVMWFVTAGANAGVGGWALMDPHKVPAYYNLQAMALVVVSITVSVVFGPPLVESATSDEKSAEDEETTSLVNECN